LENKKKEPVQARMAMIFEAESGNTLSNKIYEILLNKIINGEIKPGTRLIERDLAEEFGVSRTPIREALNRLAKDDLIEVMPHRGAYVKGLKAKDIVEIYDIRASLERLALRLAIPSIPSSEIKRLKYMVKHNSSNTTENEIQHLVSMDREFHRLIASYCDNRRLVAMLENLANVVNVFRIMDAPIEDRAKKALQEHLAILDAIEKRDVELACKLITEHIEASKQSILRHFGHILR
jgi:DNA-binding GntR family transcriptional regulator